MVKIYSQQDLDAQLRKNKSVFVLFYASWCPYCMSFVPSFDKKVASLGFKNVVHVLLDDYDNPLWDNYDIPAVPTIILFEDSKVSERLDGQLGTGLSEREFKAWIEKIKSA